MPRRFAVSSHSRKFVNGIVFVESLVSLDQWFIHWALGAGAQEPGLGLDLRGPNKLDFTRFSGYKFRSASPKGSRRSSAPRARNELKPELVWMPLKIHHTAVAEDLDQDGLMNIKFVEAQKSHVGLERKKGEWGITAQVQFASLDGGS
ncbi:hypothetical protein TNCV_3831171 [Trichonephila clavipes]|nr:hypothetical protein TNCV_3831171 [Trichonephila clavipes]